MECKFCGKVAPFKLKNKFWVCQDCQEEEIEEDEIFEYLEAQNGTKKT